MCDVRGRQASKALSILAGIADNREALRSSNAQTRDRDFLSLSVARP